MGLSTILTLLSVPAAVAGFAINETLLIQKRAPDFEWTAWGDSYASGVGAGTYVDGRRCFRFDGAYPALISADPDGLFPGGGGGKFNNVVCSGAKAEEVIDYQFYTEDQANQPSWEYSPRPASGKPTMGTVTVGGDDIDFPGILSNCVIDGFPLPLSFGFTQRSCDDQRALSWSLIAAGDDHDTPNPDLVAKIDSVLKKIVEYGQGATGDDFRLYATGYGQFFNPDDPGCNDVTFARTATPVDDGRPHDKMTTELRGDFNRMSRTLNKAIQQAVDQNQDSKVKFIDIDDMLNGHRFCEQGVNEPDQTNPNTWLFHYPYRQISTSDESETHLAENDPVIAYLSKVAEASANSLSWDPKTTLWVDFMNDFWSKVDETELMKAAGASSEQDDLWYDVWRDLIAPRVKLFHPKPAYHQAIYNAIVNQYQSDTLPATPIKPRSTSSSLSGGAGYATGVCHMHVNEWEIACEDNSTNLRAEIVIWDNGGNEIGRTEGNALADFPHTNAGNPLRLASKLPAVLEVVGDHENDNVHFTLTTNPSLSWTSKTSQSDSPNAYCNNSGWNPSEGATCSINGPFGTGGPLNAQNQIDCYFKC